MKLSPGHRCHRGDCRDRGRRSRRDYRRDRGDGRDGATRRRRSGHRKLGVGARATAISATRADTAAKIRVPPTPHPPHATSCRETASDSIWSAPRPVKVVSRPPYCIDAGSALKSGAAACARGAPFRDASPLLKGLGDEASFGLVTVGLLSLGLLSYSCANGDTVSGTAGTGQRATAAPARPAPAAPSSTGTGGTPPGGSTAPAPAAPSSPAPAARARVASYRHRRNAHGWLDRHRRHRHHRHRRHRRDGDGGTSGAACGSGSPSARSASSRCPLWAADAGQGRIRRRRSGSTIAPGTFSACGMPCMLTMTGTLMLRKPQLRRIFIPRVQHRPRQRGRDSCRGDAARPGITVTFTNTSNAPVAASR